MLYTDGVAEAEDGNGVEFGDERLALLLEEDGDLPGHHARVLQAVRQYSDGKFTDDATLVLIAVGGSARGTATSIADPAWSRAES
jgi:serine phosphatase RsbU (regulator of sigma subunit)